MELKDFIGSENEDETPLTAEIPEADEAAEESDEEKADEAETVAAEDGAQGDEDEKEEAADPYQELVTEYGSEENLREVLNFHEKFIAVDDDDPATIAAFAGEMAAISPAGYGKFVEMIVGQFAPKYGYAKPEAAEEFDDVDDYETDREKALAEENARLRAQVAQNDTSDQQSEEEQREDKFLGQTATYLSDLLGGLELHPETAQDAEAQVRYALASSSEFAAALKAVRKGDGKRAGTLVQDAFNVARALVEKNGPTYVRKSNALKVYEQNQKPKEKVNPEMDGIPVAKVQAQMGNSFTMPAPGSPLSAYVNS
jgi:hypothetical protein